jgi:hypothetical protein
MQVQPNTIGVALKFCSIEGEQVPKLGSLKMDVWNEEPQRGDRVHRLSLGQPFLSRGMGRLDNESSKLTRPQQFKTKRSTNVSKREKGPWLLQYLHEFFH